jgi:hypothetical protein
VNVARDGLYDVAFQLASTLSGGRFLLSVGEAVSDTLVSLSSGSWLDTKEVETSMLLSAGQQIMRFTVIDQPLFNFDRVIFKLNTTGIRPDAALPTLNIHMDHDGDLLISNPTGQHFNTIRIFDVQGRLVRILDQHPSPAQVKREGLSPGVYIIHASSMEQIHRGKFLLTH